MHISDTNRTLKSKRSKDKSPIIQFKGLYGDRANTIIEGQLFSELLETRSSQFNWKIAVHTHPGIYQIFYIDQGTIELHEAGKNRTLATPCVIMIPPTVLHGFDFSSTTRGMILSIGNELLDQLLTSTGFRSSMFSSLVCLADFSTSYSAVEVKRCLLKLHDELFANRTAKSMMLKVSLQELFITCYRIWENGTNNYIQSDQIQLGYFEKFKRLIREINAETTVKEIAVQLAITPVHLNRICNLVAGKSAGRIME